MGAGPDRKRVGGLRHPVKERGGGLHLKVGGGSAAKLRADALPGNPRTKIFHRNADPETSRRAAETLTRGLRTRAPVSGGVPLGERGLPQAQAGSPRREVRESEAAPREFLGPARDGPESDYVVTAPLFQGGRIFPNGRHRIGVAFRQPDR
ncbi:MAG: hypothetical protein JWM59_16 [Verrucomicrobiales bacterium]|nr:hypothetical protein [Verrucomicrobiales bacterium]